MRKVFGTITAAAGIAALAFAGSPATAATLPTADAVYILPCSNDYNGLLYKVDTETGETNRVGDWVNPSNDIYACAGPASYNPVNGLGYWISWGNGVAHLISIDLATGINTDVGQFMLDDEPYYTPIAVAIDSDGNAWATSYNWTPDTLFSLNLTTAELTVVGPTGVAPESQNFGLAWDPVTETVYGYNSSNSDFYTVNTATGAFTLFNDDVFGEVTPYAMAFDSAGQMWGINGNIISAPLADLDDFEELEVINPYADPDDGNIYSESIIIAPAPVPVPAPAAAPELAATGTSDSGVVSASFAGLLLLIAGVVMIRRRSPRTQQVS